MGYKLTGNKLAYCAEHILQYLKKSNGRRLYVRCDSPEDGARVYTYLSGVYENSSYDKGWDWEDFTMVFSSTDKRDRVFKDLDGSITQYQEAHPELGDDDTPLNPSGSNVPTADKEPETETETETTDWTTYIIIGAAAIVILLLLWDRKK